jgi:hypothetical protein
VNSLDGDVPEALLFHLVCAQEIERENSHAAEYVMCIQEKSTEGVAGKGRGGE